MLLNEGWTPGTPSWRQPIKAFNEAMGSGVLEVPRRDVPRYDFPKEVLEAQKLFGVYVGFCLAKEGLPLPARTPDGNFGLGVNSENFALMYKYVCPNVHITRHSGHVEDWVEVEGWTEICDYDELIRGYELFKSNPKSWDF